MREDKNKDQFNYHYSKQSRVQPTIYYYGPVSNLKQRTDEWSHSGGEHCFGTNGGDSLCSRKNNLKIKCNNYKSEGAARVATALFILIQLPFEFRTYRCGMW